MDKAREAFVLLDGPMGSELAARGVRTGLPLWSAAALESSPSAVEGIHRDYVRAGASVHTANTFRTQPRVLPERWEALARRAVALARAAVPTGQRVAGSMAPVEDCYRPDLSPGVEGFDEHARLASVLADAGCDLLLCETFPHLGEAWAAVEAAVATGLPTWLSLTAGPEASLLSPEEMRRGAIGAVERGASAVLVNCVPVAMVGPYLRALAGLGVPFGAYANAGRVDDGMGWCAPAEERLQEFCGLAAGWLDAGATILGGCCGTGPAHVKALSRLRASRGSR